MRGRLRMRQKGLVLACLFLASLVTHQAMSPIEAQTETGVIEQYRLLHASEDLTPPRLSARPLVIYQTDEVVNLLAGVAAIDDHDRTVTLRVEGYENPSHVLASDFKAGISYLHYQAEDQSGNQSWLKRAVIVRYRHPLLSEDQDLVSPEVACRPVYLLAGSKSLESFIQDKENILAYDQVEGDLSSQFYYLARYNQALDLNRPGHYRVVWEVEDQAHNRARLQQWVVVLDGQEALQVNE